MSESNRQGNEHARELDIELRNALSAMLSTEPSQSVIDSAIANLHSKVPERIRIDRRDFGRRHRVLLVIAASLVFLILVVSSSTDAWAEVVKDYQLPANEPVPLSTAAAESHEKEAGAATLAPAPLRAVLLTHIVSLLAGLAAMGVAWITTLVSWGTQLRTANDGDGSLSIHRRILIGGIVLYVVGLILGCVWSWYTWGRLWSWDPREAFCLITIGLASSWCYSLHGVSVSSEITGGRRWSHVATVSTTSFGLIILMVLLGGQYASDLRSVGAQSLTTWVFFAFAMVLLLIWSVDFWKTTRERRVSQSVL